MRMLLTVGLLLSVAGGYTCASAREKKTGKRTTYYRKARRPNRNATQPPKHKDQNYEQHGWN